MNPTPPPYLWTAFREGSRFLAGTEAVMSCQEIGPVLLPTGDIVACDPFTEIQTRGFERTVEPDAYGVFLAIANYSQDQRVAAAMIVFAMDARPSRWEYAFQADCGPMSKLGYGVDSGRGSFMDLKLARFLYRQAERGRLNRYQRQLDSQMAENSRPTWSWANVAVGTEPRTNILAFTTGAGDGCYPSYFGLDDAGRPICLVTDFGLLEKELVT